MKKDLNIKGLRFKLWIYLAGFATAIMIVLWLLQIVFLQTYYKSMKKDQIQNIGKELVYEYRKSTFENEVYKKSYNNRILILVFDANCNILPLKNMFGDTHISEDDVTSLPKIIKKLSKHNNEPIFYSTPDKKAQAQNIVYAAKLPSSSKEKLYLYIKSPLDPIDSTTAVLEHQLIIVTIISLFLAFVLSFFIASRLSKPIRKITKTAKELANGNYDITFEDGDYSEINQLSATLNYATHELSKTDELRKDLIANVSHDLRTPLTMIKMYAEMIRDISGDKPEKRNAHTKIIIDETDRLSGLVNDILDLSKIQSRTGELNYTSFDLANTVNIIMNRFNVMADRDGYIFNITCDGNTVINADEKKIEQVIYNLVSNAINYTGDDKTISINVIGSNKKVRFEVIDTGKGIPPEKLESIWERYYKAKETHKRAVVGTGLGLSIVKSILNAHNADFGVISKVGSGSTFWFEMNILKLRGYKND